MDDLSTEELIRLEQEIFDKWDKSGEVHSLSDYSEIVRELTIRENN